ncbi:MAG: peptidylprolyl isomerase [Bacteroidetes bacterium]|nr:MAG: peptidylprolyl isomerase [Bacteroidota bacterium]
MKFKYLSVITLIGIIAACGDSTAPQKEALTLDSEVDKVSYSFGVSIAKNLKAQKFDSINIDALTQAIQDSYGEEALQIDETAANELLNAFMQKRQQAATKGSLEEGRAWLEQNKTKEGVVTLASGLQYKILVEGRGGKALATSKVTTHYHGTLIDGTVFDSSVDRGEPASFGVNQVIAGWTEALQLMSVGSKWELYIPSELAYGANPRPGGAIKPNMALIFQVELLSIN